MQDLLQREPKPRLGRQEANLGQPLLGCHILSRTLSTKPLTLQLASGALGKLYVRQEDRTYVI